MSERHPIRSPSISWTLYIFGRILVPLVVLIAALGACEWLLGVGASGPLAHQPNYARLLTAHAPYAAKRPHPEYGFFLPDSAEIPDAGRDIVHVTGHGFRGPGPSRRGGRALAFLVGNSVVFGFVPQDSLTIAGFLNRIQSDYFFVNAGVPSWVSSQVRRRIVHELLSHQPALIVFWGGHNDASLAYSTAQAGRPFDPEMIEHPSPRSPTDKGPLGRLVPNLTMRLNRLVSRIASPVHQPNPGVAFAAAEAFVENLEASFNASMGAGTRFLAVYQPILHHHRNRAAQSCEIDQCVFFEFFRDHAATLAARFKLPYLDLGDVFDRHFASVPVFIAGSGPDLNDQVFVDEVHLYVSGNELVAREIATRIAEPSSR